MADDKGGEAKEAPEAKGGKAKLLIILIAVVALLGAGGGVAYFTGAFGGGGEAEAAKGPAAHGKEKGGKGGDGHGQANATAEQEGANSVVPLDPFVVNLADEGAQRYLKVTMKIEFLDSLPPPQFPGKQAQIRDLILTLLSSKSVGDVRTVEGKAQLRDEIIARVNRVLGDDKVKAVYFAEFIVQ